MKSVVNHDFKKEGLPPNNPYVVDFRAAVNSTPALKSHKFTTKYLCIKEKTKS
jgi:uncharacterized protein (DUF362 family)